MGTLLNRPTSCFFTRILLVDTARMTGITAKQERLARAVDSLSSRSHCSIQWLRKTTRNTQQSNPHGSVCARVLKMRLWSQYLALARQRQTKALYHCYRALG